jgi:hypothetical protein
MSWFFNSLKKKKEVEEIKINDIQETPVEVEIIENKDLSQSDIDKIISIIAKEGLEISDLSDLSDFDPLFEETARLIVIHQQGSTSLIQRKFELGYNRAGRLMDQLEAAGIVGPTRGSSPREVYISEQYHLEQILNSLESGTIPCIYSQKQITEVKEKYSAEIEEKRKEFENQILLEKMQAEEEALEFEKEMIRKEILEEERKKQLRRQVKKELIDSGKILQREKRTPIPQDIQDRVWIRDSGKCVMCGSNESLEFDHIIPFSKGGANTYRNIQLLCEKCNREKSNKIG